MPKPAFELEMQEEDPAVDEDSEPLPKRLFVTMEDDYDEDDEFTPRAHKTIHHVGVDRRVGVYKLVEIKHTDQRGKLV